MSISAYTMFSVGEVKAAAQRARQFAAPLFRVEAGFQAALLAAHAKAVDAMRPTVIAGGTPTEAVRDAFRVLYPALVRLGRAWFPRALREGWNQGNARLQAAVSGRRKLWGAIYPLPSDPRGRESALRSSGAGLKAPRKPVSDVQTVFDLDWPEIAEYIATRPVAYAPRAARTTVDMFRAQLTAGVDQGLGIADIVRDILGEQLPGISRFRAELIARTEVLSAGNAANFQNYRASGVVQKKRWLSTRDARTRETHRTQNWPAGRDVVALDKPFILPSGAKLMYPGDTSMGAPGSEWANCRCSIAPEVSMPGIPDFAPGG